MRHLDGKVAVVTGAASGIGLGLAKALAREGMSVVMADIIEGELAESVALVQAQGTTVHGVITDVSDPESVQNLAETTWERFGNVDMLCSNAGVSGPPSLTTLDATPADWERVFGVNVYGFVNCVRSFVPAMHASGRDGDVVLTASIASVKVGAAASPYFASKHAVRSIAESLRATLALMESRVKVSVLLPDGVATRMRQHEEAFSGTLPPKKSPVGRATPTMDPDEMARRALALIGEDRFYVFTHDDSADYVMPWVDGIVTAIRP